MRRLAQYDASRNDDWLEAVSKPGNGHPCAAFRAGTERSAGSRFFAVGVVVIYVIVDNLRELGKG